ncbi:hypothetical protein [Haloferula sp.]|uniref:hypothetical protein n=1 Tax=Haloferula sp. TaxID=2497595 RepID=UPI00329C75F3
MIKELWDLATSPGVLPFSFLLGCMVAFWVVCMIGSLDFDIIDIDFSEGGADSGQGGTLFGGTLRWLFRFVHGDVIPLPALASFLLVFEWGCIMLGNHFWNPEKDLERAMVIAGWSLIPSFVLTRTVGFFLRPMFVILRGTEGEAKPVIGRHGKVRSKILDARSGQVEVEDPEVPLLINARTAADADPLYKGDPVVVASHDRDHDTYLVESLIHQ